MWWLANNIQQGKIKYRIRASKYDHGTISLPTGVGKSAEIFIDMYYLIANARPGEKLILNISAPQLKLVQQQTCDFLSTLSLVRDMIGDKRMVFYINSSDNGKNYDRALREMNLNCRKFKTDFGKFFHEGNDTDIAIVATCHKSLNKFIDKLTKMRRDKRNFRTVTYIDECHLVDHRRHNDDNNISTVKIDKLCQLGEVYALSATPNHEVTMKINEYNGFGGLSTEMLYEMSPIEAISRNFIVKPRIYTRQTLNSGITADALEGFMGHARIDNPRMHHKVLVNCKSSEELRALKLEMQSRGYTVFSTCSRYGYGTEEDIDKSEYRDIKAFTDAVDGHKGDCFVMHIRQLIQGIDINSITDVVMWCQDVNNPMTARHVTQTIGRALRTLRGERGVRVEKRTKKHANVYMLSNDTNDYQQRAMQRYLMQTYALNDRDFYNSHSGYRVVCRDTLDTRKSYKVRKEISDGEIKEVLLNVETYVKTKLTMKKRLYRGLGKVLNINHEINAIIERSGVCGDMSTEALFSPQYRRMFSDISKICKRYGLG